MRLALRRVGLAVLATLALGCGPTLVRERVYDEPHARVELRHSERGGVPTPRGFSHPATISDVRIAHILSALAWDDKDEKRMPAIRSAHVYDLAEGIAAALAKAGPDDEVAAAAFPQDKRLGIFTDSRVTAFRLALVGEELQIEFFAIEEPLERDGGKVGSREYEIPAELPSLAPRFTLVPGQAQARHGPRGVDVAWRDPYYRRPVTLSFREGAARRRTVLMEMPEAESPAAPRDAPLPAGLSDAQLRALDQLDAARRAGQVREADYQRRRALILENRLDQGAPEAAPQ